MDPIEAATMMVLDLAHMGLSAYRDHVQGGVPTADELQASADAIRARLAALDAAIAAIPPATS